MCVGSGLWRGRGGGAGAKKRQPFGCEVWGAGWAAAGPMRHASGGERSMAGLGTLICTSTVFDSSVDLSSATTSFSSSTCTHDACIVYHAYTVHVHVPCMCYGQLNHLPAL